MNADDAICQRLVYEEMDLVFLIIQKTKGSDSTFF